MYYISHRRNCLPCEDVEKHVDLIVQARSFFWVCKWTNGLARPLKTWWLEQFRTTWDRCVQHMSQFGCDCEWRPEHGPREIIYNMWDLPVPDDAEIVDLDSL